MAQADSSNWDAWVQSPGGTAARVALGVVGLGLSLYWLGLALVSRLFEALVGGMGLFFTTTRVAAFVVLTLAIGATTVCAVVTPRKLLIIMATALVLTGVSLLLIVLQIAW